MQPRAPKKEAETRESTTPDPEAQAVRRKRRKPAWRKVFLEALRNTSNVTLAADTAGVHRNTAYDAKDD